MEFSKYHGLGNYFISEASFDAQFEDPDNGDFTLVAGSPYKAGGATPASDGTDIGVDMSQLTAALAANQE